MVAPPEDYDEEPVKNQVHHRHKVLNEIKKTKPNLRVSIPDDKEPPIYTPAKYNKYKRKRSDTPPPPIFFNK
jgi:hypothetical protein